MTSEIAINRNPYTKIEVEAMDRAVLVKTVDSQIEEGLAKAEREAEAREARYLHFQKIEREKKVKSEAEKRIREAVAKVEKYSWTTLSAIAVSTFSLGFGLLYLGYHWWQRFKALKELKSLVKESQVESDNDVSRRVDRLLCKTREISLFKKDVAFLLQTKLPFVKNIYLHLPFFNLTGKEFAAMCDILPLLSEKTDDVALLDIFTLRGLYKSLEERFEKLSEDAKSQIKIDLKGGDLREMIGKLFFQTLDTDSDAATADLMRGATIVRNIQAVFALWSKDYGESKDYIFQTALILSRNDFESFEKNVDYVSTELSKNKENFIRAFSFCFGGAVGKINCESFMRFYTSDHPEIVINYANLSDQVWRYLQKIEQAHVILSPKQKQLVQELHSPIPKKSSITEMCEILQMRLKKAEEFLASLPRNKGEIFQRYCKALERLQELYQGRDLVQALLIKAFRECHPEVESPSIGDFRKLPLIERCAIAERATALTL